MMVQSTSFMALVAVLLINTLSYYSAENVYCVTPTDTSCSSCPPNSANCSTLSKYAQEAKLYFTSNTTMVFMPGDHVLDINISVANITRLTMSGNSSSEIIATVVSQWTSWLQLHKCGGLQYLLFRFYLLQPILWSLSNCQHCPTFASYIEWQAD